MSEKSPFFNGLLANGSTMTGGDAFLDGSGGGVWATNGSTAIISNCVIVENQAEWFGGGVYSGKIFNSLIASNTAHDSGGGMAYSVAANCLVSGNSCISYGGGAYSGPVVGGGTAYSTCLTNCLVLNNSAYMGGGAAYCSLFGCLVSSNLASQFGGGMYQAYDVANCTIVQNSAAVGAGIDGANGSNFKNNIIYYNMSWSGAIANYSSLGSSCVNCCTIPMPPGGTFVDNITNEPAFVDFADGDFHLQSGSPCINSGYNLNTAYRSTDLTTDLDGNPRLVDNFFDIGAYEYQTPGFILPFKFAQTYGLPLDGAIDSDGDGMKNWQEAFAGTVPTSSGSVIKILSVSSSGSGNTVKWQGVAGRNYTLQRSSNLSATPPFVSIYTNGYFPFNTFTFTDTSVTNGDACFYRVQVK